MAAVATRTARSSPGDVIRVSAVRFYYQHFDRMSESDACFVVLHECVHLLQAVEGRWSAERRQQCEEEADALAFTWLGMTRGPVMTQALVDYIAAECRA
jgi:hypothetical protein